MTWKPLLSVPCEKCHKRLASVLRWPEHDDDLPSFGIPTWCEECLENGGLEWYWLECAREEYVSGKRQS